MELNRNKILRSGTVFNELGVPTTRVNGSLSSNVSDTIVINRPDR